MEESLKSARISYLTFLAVCATVLLFGFSPDKTGLYEAAINELNILRSIDKSSLHDYFYEAVDTELKDFDFKTQLYKQISNDGVSNASPDIDWSPARILPYAFKSPPLTAPLSEIERYFLNTYPLHVFKPYPESWDDAILRATRTIYHTVSNSNSKFFTIESLNLKDNSALANFQKFMTLQSGTNKQGSSDAYATLTLFWGSYSLAASQQQQVRGKFIPLESYTFTSWFNAQETLKNLTQSVDDNEILFPNLRPVWDLIRTSTIDGAIVKLSQKKSESKKSMTLLGFTANEDIIILVAPLTILFVILYLLAHIFHIRAIEKNNANILSEFPWIVLFPSFLSRTLVYGSLSILPAVANAVILIRVWDIHSNSTWFGLLVAFLSLLLGIKTLHEIICLQRPVKRYLRSNVD